MNINIMLVMAMMALPGLCIDCAEAVHRLIVRDFPCVVAIDCQGRDLYREGLEWWRETV